MQGVIGDALAIQNSSLGHVNAAPDGDAPLSRSMRLAASGDVRHAAFIVQWRVDLKLIPGLLVLIALILGLVLAGFYFGQRRLIYYPDITRGDASIASTFELARPDGVRLHGWVDRPGQSRALLYFGGNAETLQQARTLLADCCPGWSAYFLPYRGYGGNGGEPSRDAILTDALAMYDTVASRHPGQPVAVIGRSLGSGVASWVASQRPTSKLVLVTPFDSLSNVAKAHYPWLPVDWLMHERYDSADWLRGRTPPTLVMRATDDEVIPAANTDALLRALPASTRVVDIKGDHNNLSAHPAYTKALREFLR